MELSGWGTEEDLLVVEPLAMVGGFITSGGDGEELVSNKGGNKHKLVWLLHQIMAVGKVLGAFYKGFEDRVEQLLLDTKERRNQRVSDLRGSK